MKKSLCLLLFVVLSATLFAQSYPRVLLAGDYADPTIIRDGKDYYMTHSSFVYQPGLLIWHSTDLVNWTPVKRVLNDVKGSVYAPELVKYNNRYYIYYPAHGTNWVIWTDDVRGEWSTPVDLKISGIDPGHIVDEAGARYLFVNNGFVYPLSTDGLSVVGERRKVYDGWNYPQNWPTEGKDMYLESPKLIRYNGFYYMLSAEGGTAGPATSHMIVTARSKSPHGLWENSPYNPMIHTYSVSERWWSKGHGTMIDDAEGNWWVVYHAYARNRHTLGRHTLIEPVQWTSDGWCVPRQEDAPQLSTSLTNLGVAEDDDFRSGQLGWQWMGWNENVATNLTWGKDGVTISGKGNNPTDGRLLLTTAGHACYEVQAEITVGNRAVGGLLLYYNEKAFAGVTSNGKNFCVYRNAEECVVLPSSLKRHFHIRLLNRANQMSIFASADGKEWTALMECIDVSGMHHNNYKGFLALRPALFAAGKGKTTVHKFSYRDAVPQEKDMAAYLMVYHQDEDHSLHAAISRDGYSFTALNGGKPIIAGDTIADQKGIRDPHIYRGPDGAFYLAMTDLHIFAQRAGYRKTEWERDGRAYGWGNNRGLVLMKSFDLIHWNRANIRFNEISKEFTEIGCAWAPEIVFDDKTGRMMIYFTMRYGTEPTRLYYVYVNDEFNKIESVPQILFEYPADGVSAIDGDITPIYNPKKKAMEYHLFYVAHEAVGGIKHAVSDRIHGGYRYDARWYDYEKGACEAPNVWKRIGEDKWVLMYDIFTIHPHNFGFVETSDFVHFEHLGRFNEGKMKTTNFRSPKHGAVIHLTQDEADSLERFWNVK